MNNKIVSIIIRYTVIFIFFSVVYVLLFHTPLFANQYVLFYRGLLLFIVTFLFTLLTIIIYGTFRKRSMSESSIAALMVAASINLSVFIVFPVTFERSVTMFLLNSLQTSQEDSCRGLTQDVLQQTFIDAYVIKGKAIDKRINEQSLISMIQKTDQCISLTPNAENFLKMSKIIKNIYAIR